MTNSEDHENPQPAVTRRRAIAAGLAAVVVLVAIGLVFWLTGDDTDDTSSPVDPSASATASAPATGSPTPSPSPGATPSATSSQGGAASPGATVPTADAPPTTDAPLGDSSDLGNGVTVEVTRIQSVDGEAQGVGEVAAPAVRFTVRVTNETSARVSLQNSVVNVTAGNDRVPAAQLSGPGGRAMPAAVAAGESAQGVYVFSVPAADRDDVQVSYSYATTAPTVVFSGSAS